jgi:hypothetical protein
LRVLSRIDPTVRALGAPGEPEDNDQAGGIVDPVDHSEIADA